MGNDDRNRGNESEPNRSAPGDRSSQPPTHPGGYGPAQGETRPPEADEMEERNERDRETEH